MGVPSAGRPGQFLASPCWKSLESLRIWLADHSWSGRAPAIKRDWKTTRRAQNLEERLARGPLVSFWRAHAIPL